MTDPAGVDQIPPGGEPVTEYPWAPWTPAEVASRLRDVDVPWGFAAGWALDLFRGTVSREHEDVEIAVPKAGFSAIRDALPGLDFEIVAAGRRWSISDEVAFAMTHQTWVRDPATGDYKLDVFREPHDGDVWICRRFPSIRKPYAQVFRRNADGLPYTVPEVVLLFKAKLARPKDKQDLEGVLPLLDPSARRWLREALARVHPGHAWLGRI